jgi:hypothetical protein
MMDSIADCATLSARIDDRSGAPLSAESNRRDDEAEKRGMDSGCATFRRM